MDQAGLGDRERVVRGGGYQPQTLEPGKGRGRGSTGYEPLTVRVLFPLVQNHQLVRGGGYQPETLEPKRV